jgi:hypothetical protein
VALELKFGIVWSFIFLFATTLKSRPLGGRDFFLFATRWRDYPGV